MQIMNRPTLGAAAFSVSNNTLYGARRERTQLLRNVSTDKLRKTCAPILRTIAVVNLRRINEPTKSFNKEDTKAKLVEVVCNTIIENGQARLFSGSISFYRVRWKSLKR